ncbi:MAG: hypothetical protein AB1801_02125 [Chloroflexota bacterium]
MSRKIFAWVTFPEAAFEGKIGLKIEPLVKLSFREGGKTFLANYNHRQTAQKHNLRLALCSTDNHGKKISLGNHNTLFVGCLPFTGVGT